MISFDGDCLKRRAVWLQQMAVKLTKSIQKVNPEGLPNYQVPPPIVLDPSTAPPASSFVPEKDSNDDFEGGNEMDNV